MRRNIAKLALEVLQTSPLFIRMKQHPEYQDWARKLRAYGERPELRELRDILSHVAENALTTGFPQGPRISTACLRAAAELAVRAAEREPGPALILAVTANLSWIQQGDALSASQTKDPAETWELPYACAVAGIKAGAYRAALELTQQAYDVVYSITWKYIYGHPLLARYREVAQQAVEAHEAAVRDLADDLQESCAGGPDGFRAEFCALLWVLGFIPHSYVFIAAEALPSRSLCRLVVRRSIETLRLDQFMQYIWLSMRDRGPFDIRCHESLYGQIAVFHQPHRSDAEVGQLILEPDPNRVFAEALIRWFRGELTKKDREDFDLVLSLYAACDQTVEDRVRYFHRLLSAGAVSPQDLIGKECKTQESQEHFGQIIERTRAWALFQPDTPEFYSINTNGSHDIIEAKMSRACSEDGENAVEDAFRLLEKFRQAPQAYWNLTVGISPNAQERRALRSLLTREDRLMDEARGAYLMMLRSKLPWHFQRFILLDLDSLPNVERRSPQHGREQMKRILGELRSLHDSMREKAPRYARLREEGVTWSDVLAAVAIPPEPHLERDEALRSA